MPCPRIQREWAWPLFPRALPYRVWSSLFLVVFSFCHQYVGFVTKKRRRKKYDERRHQRSHRSALAASSMFSVLHVPFTMHSLLASIHCRANTCSCILFPVSCSFRLLSLCLLSDLFSLSWSLSIVVLHRHLFLFSHLQLYQLHQQMQTSIIRFVLLELWTAAVTACVRGWGFVKVQVAKTAKTCQGCLGIRLVLHLQSASPTSLIGLSTAAVTTTIARN